MRPAKIRNKLGELLARRGMSQTELARRLDVRVTLVNHYCINGIKTKRIAERYAAKLHCNPAELMEFAIPRCHDSTRQNKEEPMKKKVRYFEWGDERPGYVTTWTVDPDGRVRIGARIRTETAWRRGYESECPFA